MLDRPVADMEDMAELVALPEAPIAGTNLERLRVRVLASLYAAGASLVGLTVLLPHSARADELGLLVIVGQAYAIAAALYLLAERVPAWMLLVALAWGSALITGVAYFSGETPSPLTFFYLWIFLYSAYFFTRREALAQMAFAGLTYAALLAVHRPESGVAAWWIVGMGAPLVAAIVIRVMRSHVELLIERLYDAARTDPLTKLPNRRGFREQLDLELERARRGEESVTIVVGDLDHFRAVNDRCGRHVGDAVLQRVAETLSGGVRQIDAVARVGGEEFAAILPSTGPQSAMIVAERLRCAVRAELAGESVPVTISFGIATFPAHGETAASLLRAADEALFGAKEQGGNRAVLHSEALRGLLRESREERDVEGERFLAIVLELAEAVDVRFSGTARHSETVGRYAELMARELGFSEPHVGRVKLAGMLHDIGKVGVPDAILSKPGSLTDDEFTVIRRHPELGEQILEHPGLADVKGWVGAHHERPDGKGYPRALAGEDLPIEARILAVADAYEAMTSDRSYRDAIGHARAREELQRWAGRQFDARVVRAFLAVLERESERAEALLGSGAAS